MTSIREALAAVDTGTLVAAVAELARRLASQPAPGHGPSALREADDLLAVKGWVELSVEARVSMVERTGAAQAAGFASVPAWLRSGGTHPGTGPAGQPTDATSASAGGISETGRGGNDETSGSTDDGDDGDAASAVQSSESGESGAGGGRVRRGGRMSRGQAGAMRRNALQFRRLPQVVAAVRSGVLSHEMAAAIAAAAAALPKTAEPAEVADLEQIMLELADDAKTTPEKIAFVGRYLRYVRDPDGSESDEDKAYGRRHLAVHVDGHGGMHGRFYLPPEAAAKMQQVLDTYGKVRDALDDRTVIQRNADSFIQLLNHKVATQICLLINAESLPDTQPQDHDDDPCEPEDQRTDPRRGEHLCGEHGDREGRTDDSGDETWFGAQDRDSARGDSTCRAGGLGNGSSEDTERTDDGSHARDGQDELGTADLGEEGPGAADPSGQDECSEGDWGAEASGAEDPPADSGPADRDREDLGEDEWLKPFGLDDKAREQVRHTLTSNLGSPFKTDPDRLACGGCGRPANRLTPALLMPTGHPLPAKHAQRLLYTSQIFRVVLDAKGRVLDTSYPVRLVPAWMRRLVLLRYATCGYDSCPVEAQDCQMDHVFDWAKFNRTRADEIIPACSYHNRDRGAHPHKYRLDKLPDGTWHFTTRRRN